MEDIMDQTEKEEREREREREGGRENFVLFVCVWVHVCFVIFLLSIGESYQHQQYISAHVDK